MVWIVIAGILFLIIGPILVLLPSPRQREQMGLRRIAMAGGISVSLSAIDDPDPDLKKYTSALGKPLQPVIKCIAYQLRRKRSDDWRRTPHIYWKLVKGPGQRDKQLPPEWCWRDTDLAKLPATLHMTLIAKLSDLPADVIAVEESGYFVSLYWREKGGLGALERVCVFLESISVIKNNSENDEAG